MMTMSSIKNWSSFKKYIIEDFFFVAVIAIILYFIVKLIQYAITGSTRRGEIYRQILSKANTNEYLVK